MNSNTRPEIQFAEVVPSDGGPRVVLAGDWTVDNAGPLQRTIAALKQHLGDQPFEVDAHNIAALDTSGALLLKQVLPGKRLPAGLKKSQRELLRFLPPFTAYSPPPEDRPKHPQLTALGAGMVNGLLYLEGIMTFVGRVAACALRNLRRPRHFRLPSIARHMQETGVAALAIVGLLAVLISMVITYQAAIQLQKFGAGIFTVDLTVIALLREMSVLITSIMVAGRSGSSFAAELGVMTLREEVSALRTMGMDPIEVLVLPRVIALVITLPLLTFLADVIGLTGGGLICLPLLGIAPHEYVARVQSVATTTMLFVGMIKAPVFAVAIAVIGCYQGLTVSGSAESVGKMTTQAVVLSIFVVIMADALFSVVFAQVGI